MNFEHVLAESRKLQTDEIELLRSMFGEEELRILEAADVETSVADEIDQHLEFEVDLEGLSCSYEISFNLNLRYPLATHLALYVRCSDDRICAKELNNAARKFVSTLPLGEPQVLQVLDWLRDYEPAVSSDSSTASPMEKDDVHSVQRFWIYSHHIYSHLKRKNIVQICRNYNISGFLMPGKPGIICVEGLQSSTDAFFEEVKTWPWKRLALKHTESEILPSSSSVDSFRKFRGFKEMVFAPRDQYHMDMGLFSQFLTDHGFNDVFYTLFDIQQK